MYQACVSISACIFYVFMNIYTGYVCINGHTAELLGKKKKKKYRSTYPIFSVARYANTKKKKKKNWPKRALLYLFMMMSNR